VFILKVAKQDMLLEKVKCMKRVGLVAKKVAKLLYQNTMTELNVLHITSLSNQEFVVGWTQES
jgi:hypothetical protein